MAFKAIPSKKDIEQFIEQFVERKLKESRLEERVNELRRALGLDKAAPKAPPAPAVPAPKKKAPAKKAAPKKAAAAKAPVAEAKADPLAEVLGALDAHPKKAALVKAGKEKDQLLRSLIPLYVAQKLDVEVSSGVASKFWAKHGVTFAAPNAAKVLREHAGYAKRTAKGPRISPAGVKYVEAALGAK